MKKHLIVIGTAVLLLVVGLSGCNEIISEKPEVELINFMGGTGWDVSKGYYATFDVTVKNVGDGWAVGCIAEIQVQDQSGEVEYDGIKTIGTKTASGSISPLEENELYVFSYTVDYEMGDRSLTSKIKLSWNNKNGDLFSKSYSKIYYI